MTPLEAGKKRADDRRRTEFKAEFERVSEFMTWDQMAKHFGNAKNMLRLRVARMGIDVTSGPQAFVEDYTFLRETGSTNRQIADRLGIELDSLMRRAMRQGCFIPDPEERQVSRVLTRLIDSGERFTGDHLPGADCVASGLIKRALCAGEIRRVGSRPGFANNPVGIYQKVS